METLEVTWTRALKVWWSLAWRTLLFSFLAGLVLGLLIGGIGGLAGAGDAVIRGWSSVLGFVAGIGVAIWVVRNVLQKTFRDFRIVLVSPEG